MSMEKEKVQARITQAGANHYQVIVSATKTHTEWDRFVEACPSGKHVQSSVWAQLKGGGGWQVRRVIVYRDNQIVAGAQILVKRLLVGFQIGYVTKGPLFIEDDPQLAALIVGELQGVAHTEGIQGLFVQPPDRMANAVEVLAEQGFINTNLKLLPTATVVNDLSADFDTLLKQMRKKTRNSVRRGYKEGLIAREGTREDVEIFHQLHSQTSERRGFKPAPLENFIREWELLHPKGYLHLFIVEFEGTPISANWVIAFGNTVWATRGGWSGEYRKKRPNEVMDWHSISWAKQNGYRYYDLEGVDKEAAQYIARGEKLPPEHQQSTTSYKVGFGGNIVFCPKPVVYIANPLLRWGYETLFMPLAQSQMVHRLFDYVRAG